MIKGIHDNYDFPKGKKEANETDIECAIRETHEEIGVDIKPYINPSKSITFYRNISSLIPLHKNPKKLKKHVAYKQITMFFVYHIYSQSQFIIQSPNEVKEILWIPIAEISSYCSNLFKPLCSQIQDIISQERMKYLY